MKFYRFGLLLSVLFAGCAARPNANPDPADAALAATVASNLCVGRTKEVAAAFKPVLRLLVTPAQMKLVYDKYLVPFGGFRGVESVESMTVRGATVYVAACSFEKAQQDVAVSFDSAHRLVGLHFGKTRSRTPYDPPSYVNTNAFVEVETEFGYPGWELPGDLCLPKGASGFPIVIVVHGSGPIDRDGTVGVQKPYKDLAWGLASRGIAVLRYDKRTYVYPERMAAATNITIGTESVDDAMKAVEFAASLPGVDRNRIFVIGHSLGATAALRMNGEGAPVRGYILMSGTLRPLEDLILEQTRYLATNDGRFTLKERLAYASMKIRVRNASAARIRPDTPSVNLPYNVPACYWIDLHRDVPLGRLGVGVPVLVMHGGRDYQVTARDFELWREKFAGRTNAFFVSLPALNHLYSAGTGLSAPDEYERPGHVDGAVITDIADFIGRYK